MILGEIRRQCATAGQVEGLAECAGQTMQIRTNQALYSIIGTNFGGDGENTFQLPNLPADSGPRYFISLVGLYPQFE